MEIQFEQKPRVGKFKKRVRANSNNKFVGVRQRPSGRWVAEIKDTTQKIRMWLGTFETAEEAARAYDEAACLLRGSNTRTNFITHVSANSPLASRIRNLLNSKKTAKSQQQHQQQQQQQQQQQSNMETFSPGTSCTSSCNPSGLPSTSTMANSPISTCSGNICVADSLFSGEILQDDPGLFEDPYKPDLSNCCEELDLGSSSSSSSSSSHQKGINMPIWDFRPCSDSDVRQLQFSQNNCHQHQEMLELPKNVAFPETSEVELSEFERMKVERQISASLYAWNGVQEYMENVYDPTEAFWDLPPLCSLLS